MTCDCLMFGGVNSFSAFGFRFFFSLAMQKRLTTSGSRFPNHRYQSTAGGFEFHTAIVDALELFGDQQNFLKVSFASCLSAC